MSQKKILGSRAIRVDAADKVTGKAQYIDDLKRPNTLYAALLQSPVASGKIAKLDTTARYAHVASKVLREVTSPLDRLTPIGPRRGEPPT